MKSIIKCWTRRIIKALVLGSLIGIIIAALESLLEKCAAGQYSYGVWAVLLAFLIGFMLCIAVFVVWSSGAEMFFFMTRSSGLPEERGFDEELPEHNRVDDDVPEHPRGKGEWT